MDLFVFLDVHEAGILDSLFGIPWTGSYFPDMWWDLPANRHSQGCNFSFADGHTEHWKWRVPKIFHMLGQPVTDPAELLDFRRVQSHVRPADPGFAGWVWSLMGSAGARCAALAGFDIHCARRATRHSSLLRLVFLLVFVLPLK